MKLISALVVLVIVSSIQCNICNTPNTPGLFEDGFGNPDFEDTDSLIGDSASLTTEGATTIFLYSGNDLMVHDDGVIEFGIVQNAVPAADRFNHEYSPNASPFVVPTGLDSYTFKGWHIKTSSEYDVSGLAVGANICILKRAQKMVNGCYRDDYRSYGEITLDEVVLITWTIVGASNSYTMKFQAVVANGKDENNDPETFVMFLYEDIPIAFTPDQMPHINGNYSSGNPEFAAVCDNQNLTTLKDNSNCRCGRLLEGTYVFATREYNVADTYKDNSCNLTEAEFSAVCGSSTPDDNLINYQPNCRPAMIPVDTCTEEVKCRMLDTGDSNNVELSILLEDPYDSLIFVNSTLFDPDDPQLITDAQCRSTLTSEGGDDYSFQTQIDPTSTVCGVSYDGTTLNFVVMTYNMSNEDSYNIAYGKTKFIHGTCRPGDLPFMLNNNVTMNGVLGSTVRPHVERPIRLVVIRKRNWEKVDASYNIIAQDVVFGRDIYMAIVMDYGDNTPIDNVNAYGVYPDDCWASNNDGFQDSGSLFALKIVGDGCPLYSYNEPFGFEAEFEGVYSNGTEPKGQFNFVISSGAFRAIWWFFSNRKVYLRCTIGVCLNQGFFDNSRCSASCTNRDVNFNSSVEKRSADESDSPMVLTTSFTIVEPTVNADISKQEAEECLTNTVAITTLVALIVLLLLSMMVTLALFIKLQKRQKK